MSTKLNPKLDAMPAEVLCRIADFIPNDDVRMLRLVSRAIQAGTFNAFTDQNFKVFKRKVTVQNLRQWSSIFDCESIANSVRILHLLFLERWYQEDIQALHPLFSEVLAKLPNITGIKIFCGSQARDNDGEYIVEQAVETFLSALSQQQYALETVTMTHPNLKASTLTTLFKHHRNSLQSMDMFSTMCFDGTWAQILPTLRNAPRLKLVHFNRIQEDSNWRLHVVWSQSRVVRAVRNPERKIKIIDRQNRSKYTTVSAIEYYTTDQHDARIEGQKAVAPGIESLVKYRLENIDGW